MQLDAGGERRGERRDVGDHGVAGRWALGKVQREPGSRAPVAARRQAPWASLPLSEPARSPTTRTPFADTISTDARPSGTMARAGRPMWPPAGTRTWPARCSSRIGEQQVRNRRARSFAGRGVGAATIVGCWTTPWPLPPRGRTTATTRRWCRAIADCWVTVRPGGSKCHARSRRIGAVAVTSTQHSRRPSAASSMLAQVVVRTPGGSVRRPLECDGALRGVVGEGRLDGTRTRVVGEIEGVEHPVGAAVREHPARGRCRDAEGAGGDVERLARHRDPLDGDRLLGLDQDRDDPVGRVLHAIQRAGQDHAVAHVARCRELASTVADQRHPHLSEVFAPQRRHVEALFEARRAIAARAFGEIAAVASARVGVAAEFLEVGDAVAVGIVVRTADAGVEGQAVGSSQASGMPSASRSVAGRTSMAADMRVWRPRASTTVIGNSFRADRQPDIELERQEEAGPSRRARRRPRSTRAAAVRAIELRPPHALYESVGGAKAVDQCRQVAGRVGRRHDREVDLQPFALGGRARERRSRPRSDRIQPPSLPPARPSPRRSATGPAIHRH